MAVITVNPGGLDTKLRLEAMMRRILLQVLHELIPCHPAAELTGNPVARKIRQPANGVQMQPVIAGPPLLPDVLPPLQNDGAYATRPQRRRRRQSPRPSTDDDDLVHPQRLLLDRRAATTGQGLVPTARRD